MAGKDFTATFLVDRSPKEAFDAINNVRGWWSEEVEGPTDKIGEEFEYHYKGVHTCRIKVTELVPSKKVAWLVVDNYFNFVQDRSEWSRGRALAAEKRKHDDVSKGEEEQ